MNIKVADDKGNIYTMPSKTDRCILEVHYTKSSYEFIVQDVEGNEKGDTIFPKKSVIVPLHKVNERHYREGEDDNSGTIIS